MRVTYPDTDYSWGNYGDDDMATKDDGVVETIVGGKNGMGWDGMGEG